jgi:hypothetical protein
MTGWFIIGPKGGVYRDEYGSCYCATTRRRCIHRFSVDQAGWCEDFESMWPKYEALGYRCEKRRIVE